MPRISIITINLNNAAGLAATIQSVAGQTTKAFEFIIIDGGSEDSTIEIIKKSEQHLNYWISEPDSGIYQAMNKGILKASGDYCLFLNSGDVLNDNNVLAEIERLDPSSDIAGFAAMVEGGKNNRELVLPAIEISFYTFYKHTVIHQSTLIKRQLFQHHGLYLEDLKIVGDWEFFTRVLFLHQASYRSFPLTLAVFDATGISSLPENYPIASQERAKILEKNFRHFLPDYKLLKDKTVYDFLRNLNRLRWFKSMYMLNFRAINRLAKLFKKEINRQE